MPLTDDDDRLKAATRLIGRTGADMFQLRYNDDPPVTVWIAIARWQGIWECAAAMHPLTAVLRLCEQTIDGGHCTHCHRPTGFEPGTDPGLLTSLDELLCWYRWDADRKTFRRSCE